MSDLSRDRLLELYRQMVLIRRFEEKAAEAYTAGKIGGFLHLYIGEEAIAVGACAAMQPKDHMFTAYRDHGWAIARGLDPRRVMAEMFGKATGVVGGKGGSMHMASAEHHYWGGHAIVGAHLPLAAGVGLAIRYENKDEAVVCSFGDGSTNIGYFHESVNLSAVWDLPVVWLVENNQYGMGTEVSRASAVKTISEKGRAYDIAYKTVNGQDLLEMVEAMHEALEHARTKGPYLLEAMTYRYSGHSMGDPERYRSKAEIDSWRSRDPILRFAKHLTDNQLAGEATLTEIDASVGEQIEEVMRFADESPEPEDAALCEFVYVNPQGHR